jgi:hypothetical protein
LQPRHRLLSQGHGFHRLPNRHRWSPSETDVIDSFLTKPALEMIHPRSGCTYSYFAFKNMFRPDPSQHLSISNYYLIYHLIVLTTLLPTLQLFVHRNARRARMAQAQGPFQQKCQAIPVASSGIPFFLRLPRPVVGQVYGWKIGEGIGGVTTSL